MSESTGQSIEKIARDSERDFYMSPLEAKEYGIIDEVVVPKLIKPVVTTPPAA
jgi:ATP-dependent Clp protease protease subunit